MISFCLLVKHLTDAISTANKLLYGFLITPGNLAVDKKSRLNADNF
jgi:hypothetical protein